MAVVRIVSKPVAPPWTDASKNIVRTILEHGSGCRYRYFTSGEGYQTSATDRADLIQRQTASYAPGLGEQLQPFLRLLVPEADVDLHHFFFTPNPRTSLALKALFALKGGPTVQTLCSAPTNLSGLSRLVFTDVVVCVSRATASALRSLGVRNVECIYPGIGPIAADPARASAQGLPNAGGDTGVTVLYSGDYEFSGAHTVIARALPALFRDVPSARFVFACRRKTAAAGAIRDALASELRAWVDDGRVVFLDEVSDFPALLTLVDIVVFPVQSLAHKMDIPLTLVEAMALGKPIVVSNLPSLTELLPEPGGLVVPPGDESALGRAMTELARDPAIRQQMGDAGRAIVRDRFNAAAMVHAYEQLYATLI